MSKTEFIIIGTNPAWRPDFDAAVFLFTGLIFMRAGSALDNGAIEVAGFFAWVLGFFAIAPNTRKTTDDEARARLDEIEAAE